MTISNISLSVCQLLKLPSLRILCLNLHTIFKLVCLFPWYIVFEFFVYLDIRPLSDMQLIKKKLLIFRLLLCTNNDVIFVQQFFSSMRSHLLIVNLYAWDIDVLFRKFFSMLIILRQPKFLFYQVQCMWVYVEALGPFGVEFCWVICRDLFAFFYMKPFIFTSTICWRCCIYSRVYFPAFS